MHQQIRKEISCIYLICRCVRKGKNTCWKILAYISFIFIILFECLEPEFLVLYL